MMRAMYHSMKMVQELVRILVLLDQQNKVSLTGVKHIPVVTINLAHKEVDLVGQLRLI